MEAGVETGELAGADDGGELAGHVYAVYVHDTQGAVCKLSVQGDDRDNGHSVAVADIGLDGLGAAEFNDHIEIIYTETVLAERILSLACQLLILLSRHVSCYTRTMRHRRHDCSSTAGSVARSRTVS